MTTLHERIATPLAIDEAFAYVADFSNAAEWDPGVAEAERLDEGPVGRGSRFRLGVRLGPRVVPMGYSISEFDPPNRVVLVGSGSGISAVDEIRFESLAGVTQLDYTADIQLHGLLRIVEPLLGRALTNVGRNAADGMQRTLDAKAKVSRPDRHERDHGQGAA